MQSYVQVARISLNSKFSDMKERIQYECFIWFLVKQVDVRISLVRIVKPISAEYVLLLSIYRGRR